MDIKNQLLRILLAPLAVIGRASLPSRIEPGSFSYSAVMAYLGTFNNGPFLGRGPDTLLLSGFKGWAEQDGFCVEYDFCKYDHSHTLYGQRCWWWFYWFIVCSAIVSWIRS